MIGRSNIITGSNLNFQVELASKAPNQIENLNNFGSSYVHVNVDNEARTISYQQLPNLFQEGMILYSSQVGDIESRGTYYFQMKGPSYGQWYLSTSQLELENSVNLVSELTRYDASYPGRPLFLCLVYHYPFLESATYSDLYFSKGLSFLPDTAKENTILIQTETPISSWSFSYSQPSQPSQGQVWFQYENNLPSAFSIFKNKKVNIGTESCEQYDGTNWETKTFYMYQDGHWYENSITPLPE